MKYFLNFIIFLSVSVSSLAYVKNDGDQFTTFAGFKLGTVTLSHVQGKFRTTELNETGEAGEYKATICYKTKYGFIHFLSGEMGGDEHDLLGFGASRVSHDRTCAKPIDPNHLLKLPISGIYLGMTKSSFSRVANKPVQWNGNIGHVFFESKRHMSKNEINKLAPDVQQGIKSGKLQNYFDVQVAIEGSFQSGVLTSFEIWKVETQ